MSQQLVNIAKVCTVLPSEWGVAKQWHNVGTLIFSEISAPYYERPARIFSTVLVVGVLDLELVKSPFSEG